MAIYPAAMHSLVFNLPPYLTPLLVWSGVMVQRKWTSLLGTKKVIPLRRGRVFIVGEAGVGKTSLLHALLNMPFKKKVKSTIGTVDATNTHEWEEMPGTEYEQVTWSI